MIFYLAAPRNLKGIAAPVITELERRGHTCAFNWTEHIDTDMNHAEAARECIGGVVFAEQFVALLPANTPGTNVEIGIALSCNVPTTLIELVCNPDLPGVFDPSEGNIFYQLAERKIRVPMVKTIKADLVDLIERAWGKGEKE